MTENHLDRPQIERVSFWLARLALLAVLSFGSPLPSSADSAVCAQAKLDVGMKEEKIPHSESSASLKETLDWLRQRVPEFADYTFPPICDDTRHFAMEELDLSGCEQWRFKQAENYDELDFSPKDVDPQAVTIIFFGLDPKADKCGPCVDYTVAARLRPGRTAYERTAGQSSTLSSEQGAVTVSVRSHEQAERVAKALRHALELCSGESAASAAHSLGRGGRSFRDCDECPEMVVLPAGSFTMGSPASEPKHLDQEGPLHRVTIHHTLAVGKYPVTVDQYARFASEYSRASNEWRTPSFAQNPNYMQTGRDPVVRVNWYDPKAYAAWLSEKTGHAYRLLSEAEWEYAERAGTSTPYWWGNSDADICRNASDGPCNHYVTVPVESYPANAFGLSDMAGNVWEWTEDCWHISYAGAPNDGTAWTTGICRGRVQRGGPWGYMDGGVRSAFRYLGLPENGRTLTGFRVARRM